jgi:tetratricopeptide (TPR) repeat protein
VLAAGATLADIAADQQRFADAEKQMDALFRRFGDRPAERADLVLARARLLQREGKTDDAIALLRDESRKFTDPYRVYDANMMLMEMYAARGDVKPAEDTFNALAKTANADANRLCNAKMTLARAYETQGREDLAIAIYHNIIDKYPAADVALQAKLNLAGKMRREGDRTTAEKLWREVVAEKNDSWEVLSAGSALSDLLAEQQRFDEANGVLDELQKRYAAKNNDRAEIALSRANVLQRQKKPDAAVALLGAELPQVTDPNRRFEMYRTMMELDRDLDKLSAMEGLYKSLIGEFGADSDRVSAVKLIYARAYADKGKNDKALALFKESAARNPHLDAGLSARLDLGNLYRRTGDFQQAEQTYRELLDEPGLPWQSFDAGVALADMYSDQERLADADKLLARMRKIWVGAGNERSNLILRQARLLRREKKPQAAVALLEGEIGSFIDPERVFEANVLLIETCKAVGDTKKAEAILAKIEAQYAADAGKLQRARDAMKK